MTPIGLSRGLNRLPLNNNKSLGRCQWCAAGYCKCCTNDGADEQRFCSVFCQMKAATREAKDKENERTKE